MNRWSQCLLLGAILAGGYVIYVSVMASLQDRIIFVGQGIPMTTNLREENSLAFYTKLKTSFGEVHACYLESERDFDDCPIVFVAHGNAETIGHWEAITGHLNQLGLSVFLVEYPGYGGSDGLPSKETIAETFDQGHAWLETRGLSRRRLIGFGHGFGTGPLLELATRKRFDGIILTAPYTSLGALTWETGLPSFLLKTRYDNINALTGSTYPVLLIHGRRDRLITPKHSERLLQVDSSRITYEPIDAAHEDLWGESDAMVSVLSTWLNSYHFLSSP
ncbi:MAG: hypothetical protein GWQ08_19090 [Verrucomicrobiaceae bacterium]|nr:hypothetical protein [Verrucomicrobiaceae bacterium]